MPDVFSSESGATSGTSSAVELYSRPDVDFSPQIPSWGERIGACEAEGYQKEMSAKVTATEKLSAHSLNDAKVDDSIESRSKDGKE